MKKIIDVMVPNFVEFINKYDINLDKEYDEFCIKNGFSINDGEFDYWDMFYEDLVYELFIY